MAKSLLYRLLGLGKILKNRRAQLEEEGIVLMDEGIPASMTLRNFSGMGQYASRRWTAFTAALVLTKSRLYGNSFFREVIDIPLKDEHLRKIVVNVDEKGRLNIAFEASDFMPATGHVQLRFKTSQAQSFLDALQLQEGMPQRD